MEERHTNTFFFMRTKQLALILFFSLITTQLIRLPSSLGSLESGDYDLSSIEQTYSFSKPLVQQTTNGDIVTIDALEIKDHPGEPLLPVQSARLLLPPETTVESISVITSTPVQLPGIFSLAYGQEPVPLNAQGPAPVTPKNQQCYSSLAPYPDQLYEQIGIQTFRGYHILLLNIYPVSYIPKTGILSYYPTITIHVSLHHAQQNNNRETMYRANAVDEQEIIKKIDNNNIAYSYNQLSAVERSDKKSYDLLIITTESLQQGFIPLANAHNKEGTRTVIKTLGRDINISTDYNQTCTNIRDYIRNAYQQWSISYVLLGGDIDLIPSPYFFYGRISYVNIYGPSDTYYACLDGVFNSDNDHKWGEPHDGENNTDVDLLAEVYVGRICAGNLSEVGYSVNKTIHYMQTQEDNPYLLKMTFLGEYLTGPDQFNPLTYSDWYMQELIDGSTANGYTTVGIPTKQMISSSTRSYVAQTLFDGEWQEHGWQEPHMNQGGWPKQLLIGLINNGTHVVDHLGHSGNFYNMKLYVGDVDALSNTKPCFIYSQGCTAGAYDQNAYQYVDCIAEHFTVKTKHGAFAGIWNAREGFYMPNGTDSDDQYINRQFWNAVFGRHITEIGRALQEAKEEILPFIYQGRARWIYYGLHLLGDPSVRFHIPYHAEAHGPYPGFVDRPVQFTGDVFGGTPPYQYFWDLGDGKSSYEQNPRHTYIRLGSYPVKLKVTDSKKRSDVDLTTAVITLGDVYVDRNYTNTTPGWGYDHFNTIQDGINAVGPQGNVFVASGLYHEALFINQSLNLIGEQKNTTILEGLPTNTFIIFLQANTMSIQGFTFRNTEYGITGSYVSDITITDNTFLEHTGAGITLSSSERITIKNNDFIRNTARGIYVSGRLYLIQQNRFVDNSYSIELRGSQYNTIVNNTISSNGIGDGIGLWYCSDYARNVITKNRISGSSMNGIRLKQSSGNYVFENTITGVITSPYYGITVYDNSRNNQVYHNNFNNTRNAYDACQNSWSLEYPIGGNYWSDYTEQYPDPHDILPPFGIWDDPYIISGATPPNMDYCPFTTPNGWL
ncbi:MAG: C25 family cysteine peptidase [Methanobacteriota archaeon]